jgi:hypothetical protein
LSSPCVLKSYAIVSDRSAAPWRLSFRGFPKTISP